MTAGPAPHAPATLWLEHVPSIDSTNAALLRRPLAAHPAAPRGLWADIQTAGRGRMGRSWTTDPQTALAVSVALERPQAGGLGTGLPLALGVALAQALAAHGAQVRLKWPNDVYVAAHGAWAKAGGLLVELRQGGGVQRIVMGCGLNLEPSPLWAQGVAPSPGPLPVVPPGALFAPGSSPPRAALAQTVAQVMLETAQVFVESGLAPWLAPWSQWDLLADQSVCLIYPDGRHVRGCARGIAPDGALCLEHPDGRLERLHSAEVSLRLV